MRITSLSILLNCCVSAALAAISRDAGTTRVVNGVQVKMWMTWSSFSSRVNLTCEASGIPENAIENSLQFYCPALGGKKCMNSCKPSCHLKPNEACVVDDPILDQPYINCSEFTVRSSRQKRVQLLFDIRKEKLQGEWYCQFHGVKSSKLSLHHVEPTTTTRLTTATTATTAKETQLTTKWWTSTTETPPTRTSPSRTGGLGEDDEDWGKEGGVEWSLSRLARRDYIIGLLALLATSLVINVGFCVRCVLARIYVGMRRHKQEPPGCLAACLCVSTVQVVENTKEDTYEEVAPRLPRRDSQQRASVRTMETTYIEHAGCLPRSRTMPPARNAQLGLYYLQGVSDSMSRILYDDVAPHESRPGSRQGSRPASPSSGPLLSNRHSRSRGSLRGLHKMSTMPNSSSVPVVPEEVPFVAEAGDSSKQQQQQQQQQQQSEAGTPGEQEEDDDAKSDYSGTTRLELSRMMLRKADTLLREANSLLRDTAHTADLDASD